MLPRDADLDAPHRPEDPDADVALASLGEEGDEPAAAPAVVAVVVAHDPGAWFEDCLTALDGQDYPALSVLIIDAASATDPTSRVAAVLPSAYVRKLEVNPGFGPAANEVLEVVEGASFFLLCHDDVAPAADAVRAMVEEAFRSNAGIVTPKLVDWADPRRLLQVGMGADKTGVPSPLNERGELDQEQHDAVLDVFVAPGGCTLVRADLFRALGGFDPAIDLIGEDLDLSWRAQVAGARVVVAPAAVVRHVEALATRHDVGQDRRLQARHRLRTMLTCYSPWHLLRVVPQAFVLMLAEVVYSLAAGRVPHAGDVGGAWTWNLRRVGELRANRKRLQALRQEPDSEVRRMQARGSSRLSAFLRGQIGVHGDDRLRSMSNASRELADSLRRGPRRTELIALGALVVVVAFGTRALLVGGVPAFGDMPAYPSRSWTLLGDWVSGWRTVGLGSSSPAPTAFGLLGLLGTLTIGSLAILRRVVLLGPLIVGGVGAWRMLADQASRRARVVAAVAYLAMPLPYNAIARGRGGGLLLWAAAPWFMRALARVVGDEPFRAASHGLRRDALRLGLPLALLAALVPFEPIALVITACGLALGGAVVGRRGGGARVVGAAIGGLVVAFVLHVPWSLDLVGPGTPWSSVGGLRSASPLNIGDIIRFRSGPLGAGPLGLGFLAAALLPLVIGQSWRFRWALRAWVVTLTCWGTVWVGQQSWFRWGLGPPEALLAPASASLTVAIALGLVAFELDLPGYRFGWRQGASVAAAVALSLGVLPMVGATSGGRWGMPDQGLESVVGFLHDEQAQGPFRVLWLGDPDVLPVGGWELSDGLAYGTSNGLPRVEDRLVGSAEGATSLLGDALKIADRRETARLGRLLAPLGVRYIVVAEAATPFNDDVRPLAPDLLRALDEQLDLEAVPADPLLHVYRNAAWAPERAALAPDAVARAGQSSFFSAASGTDLTGTPTALPDGDGRTTAHGPVAIGSYVYVAQASSSGWHLSVDGKGIPRQQAFGWANGFPIDKAGTARLSYQTPITRYAALVLQVGLWIGAVVLLSRWGRRRRSPGHRAGVAR
ncbi:MAG: glycosyltransferase [Acidimicrobiales bacterium]